MGRLFSHPPSILSNYFNPPTRVEWDQLHELHAHCHHNFNPPTRVEWDLMVSLRQFVQKPEFQSTHSRGVGPRNIDSSLKTIMISIHPLAWSGTYLRLHKRNLISISIHPLAWSGTSVTAFTYTNMRKFQSTHSRGVGRYL